MLSDLDTLLRERNIDTLVVPMHEAMHASFRWLSRGAKVTKGYAVKRVGHDPLLVTYPMEREEAAATGLEVHLVAEYDHEAIFRATADQSLAHAKLFANIFRAIGSGNSIAIFGNVPFQLYLGVAEALEADGFRVHRSHGEELIQLARKRKEEWEVEAIRSVGQRTEQVVLGVQKMLREAVLDGDRLLFAGRPLSLGDLKAFVSQEIARLGMVEDHETILSQGRDAGVPHSRGDASALVRPSSPIVLDIFPADRASGYFFDLTRTFCVGPAPTELRQLYSDVLEAFTRARDSMRPGTLASDYQNQVCEFFEAKGYATLRSDPKTHEGYVHGLGHGVGLDVHEKPSFALTPTNRDAIEVGDIVTIEPGLYFPTREMGVRIEDTFVVREHGVESLASIGYGLEI